jgi:hypothetical protein
LKAAISRASQVCDEAPPAELELLVVGPLPPLPLETELLPVEPVVVPPVPVPVVAPLAPSITDPVQPATSALARINDGPKAPMLVEEPMLCVRQPSCHGPPCGILEPTHPAWT